MVDFDSGLIGPVQRLAFALTPSFTGELNTFVDQKLSSSDFTAGDVNRLLFAHLARSPLAVRAYQSNDPEALGKFGDRFCFFDNVEDMNAPEQMTGPITTGQEPGFVDLAAWRVDQTPESPCPEAGTHEAGITRMNWALARMGFGPEHTGAVERVEFLGAAEGGSVTVRVNGVLIVVTTEAGESAADVAQTLAAAVQANPGLAAQGVGALAVGGELEINGSLSAFTIADPGLYTTAQPVPVSPGPWAAVTGLLIAGALWRLTARRRS